MSQIFNFTEEYSVHCEFQSTRSGFRHVAKIYKDGAYIGERKMTYVNRTWEAYKFQSVLEKALEAIRCQITKALHTRITNKINSYPFG